MDVGIEVREADSCINSQCSQLLSAAKHADQGWVLSSNVVGSQAHLHVPGLNTQGDSTLLPDTEEKLILS